jgi:hypothetical protein
MTTLQAHGISCNLPSGFEGRIFQRTSVGGAVARPVAHFSTFALPADVADFGAGAVNLMAPQDIFSSLFEYGPESLGTALFAQNGMPRQLGPQDFSTITLRRGMPSQSGTQWFFTESGRPFTLYVVLGNHGLRNSLVPRVNALLGNVDVSQTGSTAP